MTGNLPGSEPLVSANLTALFSQAPAPIAIYAGRELVYVFVNEAYGRIFNGREILGKPLRAAFPELEGQRYFEILEAVYHTGTPFTAHETPALIDLDGTGQPKTCYYDLVYTPYRTDSGAIAGVMAFGHDVTAQVEARIRETESESRFRSLVDDSPDPILILTGEELLVQVANQPLLSLWNIGPAAIGQPLLTILPELRGQDFHEYVRQVLRSGIARHSHETPVTLLRNGQHIRHDINFVCQPYRDGSGAVTGVLVFAHDVSEQVRERRQVFESEERLRMALEASEMGTWETDPQSQTLYFSDRCLEIMGLPPGAAVTKKEADEAILPQDRPRVADAIRDALRPGSNGHYSVEYSIHHRQTGEIRTLKASGRAFFRAGTAQRFIGTVIDITHEVRIRAEQRKLLTLIDNSVELMSVLELDGHHSYLNKAGRQMLGFNSFAEVLSTPVSQLHTPEDAAFVNTTVRAAVLADGRWSGIMNVRHLRTGEVFPVYNNTIRIDDPVTGQPIAFGSVMRDMRPEMAARQALAESEANFRNIILQAPVAMSVLMGPDHIVQIANEQMFTLWGKDAPSMLGKPLFQGLPEAKEQGFEQMLRDVYEKGERFTADEYPARLPRAGGIETAYINFVYEAFRGSKGAIEGVIATAVDVTAQVTARHQVEYAEEAARLAIESADLGAYEVNLVTNDMRTSDRFKAIWGHDFDLDRGRYASVIHPDDLPIRNAAHTESLRTGRVAYEARVIWTDGSEHWVKVIGRLFRDRHGDPAKLLGVAQDITEQKLFSRALEREVEQRTRELQEANDQLRRTNAELEQFAYVSSHDLQEPLRKIRMFAGMIRDRDFDRLSDYSQQRFDKITEAAQRMSTSLKDLLNFSSLGREEQFTSVDLNEVLASVSSDLELLISQKEATIQNEGLPVLQAIPLQMNQLLYNLLNNALKFARKDIPPVIRLSSRPLPEEERASFPQLKPDRSYIEVVVRDNGIGFAQETADKIFLLFQRLHDRQAYSGTGIGLALCRKVALNHDGDIFAKARPGEGAAFHVLLPVS
ncbi:MAG: sensor signal transduction histidine kinase [Flaviaesturariibacter sp.]|nr:sensor signal transduction histidine kinase [Flaviaesturariibacter sp.]